MLTIERPVVLPHEQYAGRISRRGVVRTPVGTFRLGPVPSPEEFIRWSRDPHLSRDHSQLVRSRRGFLRPLGDGDDPLIEGRERVLVMAGGAGLATIERFIAQVNLTNNQSAFQDMPRDFIYAGCMLNVSGTLTCTATTPGTLADENPWEYVNRVIFEATGGGNSLQYKSLRGRMLARAAHLFTGTEPQANPIVSAATQAGTAWNAIVPFWFFLVGARIPPEVGVNSVLDPREFGKLQLQIDALDQTAFINGGTYTVGPTVNAPIANVFALQALNVALSQAMRPFRYIEQYFLRDATSAISTDTNFSQPFPVGKPYRYVAYSVRNEATNLRQPVDDAAAAVRVLLSQTQIYRYLAFQEYANRQREWAQVVTATNPAGLNPLGSRANPVVGYYMFDFARDGRLQGMLDTSRFPAKGIIFDWKRDVATASARQWDVFFGFFIPGGKR